MLLSDLKTKYQLIELIESNYTFTRYKLIGLINKNKADILYGNRIVLSIKDYDDTKTTSIIIAECEVN